MVVMVVVMVVGVINIEHEEVIMMAVGMTPTLEASTHS